MEQMNQNLLSRVLEFLRRKMWNKRWQKTVTCLAAVAVFGVTYALILPAITMTGKYPVLSAETLTAWTGDELAVKVSAETAPEDGGKIIVLTLEGEGADLSQNYAFNEDGVCVIIDEAQNEIELHRAVREETKNTVDYWFAMEPGTETVFTLNLADEVDATRFAETMEAVKLSGEEMAAEAEKATTSDAGKSAAVQTEKKETGKATPADAEKKAEVKKASASNADVAEANKIAENSEEKIETESRDEGFVEILDGAVINDLEAGEDEEEEQTEIVAELKVSAGVGDDYENAVKDAEKNADKRGDAQLKFQWKDVVAKQAEAPELVSYLNGATIAVFFDENAGIPAGATLSVREIEEGTDEYAGYLAQAKSAMDKATASDASKTVTHARFFDITILDEEGEEVEPQAAVKVVITYEEAVELSSDSDLNVVHFKNDDTQEVFAPVKPEEKQEVDALSFTTDSFSVFGVVSREVIVTTFTAGDGTSYEVVVNYGEDAGVPRGASLQVAELTEADPSYNTYVEKTAEKIESDVSELNYIRLLDISIVDGNGGKVSLTAPVDVQIRLLDKPGVDDLAQVVHFAEDKTTSAEVPEVVDCAVKDDVVTFKAEGFSVYAIVKMPSEDEIPETGWLMIESVSELAQYGGGGIYIRHPNGYYFTDEAQKVENPYQPVNQEDANYEQSDRTGIVKTQKYTGDDPSEAHRGDVYSALYYFEIDPETTNQFKVYCKSGENKKYLKHNSDKKSLLFADDEHDASVFTISKHENPNTTAPVFVAKCGEDELYWNMRHSEDGKEFCINVDKGDQNARIQFLRYMEAPEDPFNLNGEHYGLVYYNRDHNVNTTAKGQAMMAEVKSGKLSLKEVEGKMEHFDFFENFFLAKDSETAVNEITMWEFEHVRNETGPQNQYRIFATVNGAKKYLGFVPRTETTLGLYDLPGENTLITINAGTKDPNVVVDTAGMIQLQFTNYDNGDKELYVTKTDSGFTGGNDGSKLLSWLYLASLTDYADSVFAPYSATKISVSDKSLSAPYTEKPKSKVIVYTRVWDDEIKRYKFFAIDKNGGLVRCYDGGGDIFWYDIDPDDLLWEFTEYLGADNKPSFYYELQNWNNILHGEEDKFIAPQITGDQTMSGRKIGINMNGRRYGDYFSKIIAWDKTKYAYAGLLANLETNALDAVPMSLSSDWYFAIVEENEGKLTKAETIDHEAYGIKMRLFDYNNKPANPDNAHDKWQETVMGGYQNGDKNPVLGLVKRNLGEDGYPQATKKGNDGKFHSLKNLFPDGPTGHDKVEYAQTVNNLFIKKTLEESGYFEFDSTQNYAVIGEPKDGVADFIVYDQLGSFLRGTEAAPTNSFTTQHGQFDPFNPLDKDDNGFADNGPLPFTNRYDIHGNELSPLDPRYGEALYMNGTNETMDFHFGMEMSASFMQTPDGKDDWGHDIIFEFSGDDDFWLFVDDVLVLDIGGIHYASDGDVNFATGKIKNQGLGDTNLRTVFTQAYKEKNPNWTQEGLNEYLTDIFGPDPNSTVFKSYSSHTMRIFYMERGANASNIHMRFNLAPTLPGAVELEKHVEGTNQQNYASTKFAYQIFWREKGGTEFSQVGDSHSEEKGVTVLYKATGQPVEHSGYPESDPAAVETEPWTVTQKGTKYHYYHVYFLKPEEHAIIQFPDEDVEYYIKECYVNTYVFNQVDANEIVLSKLPASAEAEEAVYPDVAPYTPADQRKNYRVETKAVSDRKQVKYVNHVNPKALHTLRATKVLHDKTGGVIGADTDPTPFRFRLYFGSPLEPYATADYHVIDPNNCYCTRDNGVWISTGKRNFEELDAEQKKNATFQTGPWGTADDILSGYTVEVRGLLPETEFLVEETPADLPLGYDLGYYPPGDSYTGDGAPRDYVDYERILNTVGATYDLAEETDPLEYNHGIIKETEDAEMKVHNRKGWGLNIKKTWTDSEFMDEHDTIYFAAYYQDGNELKLLEYDAPTVDDEAMEDFSPVRAMKTDENTVTYFLDALKRVNGEDLKLRDRNGAPPNYWVYEVELEPKEAGVTPNIDDGCVTNYNEFNIRRVTGTDPDKYLHSGGAQTGQAHASYTYVASYGNPAFNTTGNGVAFSVTNSRPGVKIIKTRWDDFALLGADFTIKDQNGEYYSTGEYTSGDFGLVVMAYFGTGEPYTLTEKKAPAGYVPLPESVKITVGESNMVTVESTAAEPKINIVYRDSDPAPTQEELAKADIIVKWTPESEEQIATITVRDRESGLQLRKVSKEDNKPLQGAHFQLRQDNNGTMGTRPMPGYEDLITDANGVIPPNIFAGLKNNKTYYLIETQAPENYRLLPSDQPIKFTLTNGSVRLDDGPEGVDLETTDPDEGNMIYTIVVPDEFNGFKVRFKKTTMDKEQPLQSADFATAMTGTDITLTSGTDGIMSYTENGEAVTIFSLPVSNTPYELKETKAPNGYIKLTEKVYVEVKDNDDEPKKRVTAYSGTGASLVRYDVNMVQVGDDVVYEVIITNSNGVELPHTGGPGTLMYTLSGLMVLIASAVMYGFRRRHEERRSA